MTEPAAAENLPPPFEHSIRVTWADCDPARIAYTARLPYFALDAIDAWWDHHLGGGWYHMELDLNMGTPFVHMSLDFLSPVTPRHRLICRVWPSRLGQKSITFRVDGLQDGTLCFKGQFVNVFTVADSFTSQEAPPPIRDLVLPLICP
ncbi:acyl-CoA thioesterase [Pseudodonghicola flavimaris]|uniref:Thioesterase family protein n=1 Tax=Pseudodonghicola flavimaris TaxID=3050036 RepID=A0ABT7EWZ0_9RHOB|nr:thioesterase family protein [Pseudodonghicola flavimaris]MDK3016857.1 thioesterase family protein [Pseudodonghicola flavimaris]